jgi:hypothetical protein
MSENDDATSVAGRGHPNWWCTSVAAQVSERLEIWATGQVLVLLWLRGGHLFRAIVSTLPNGIASGSEQLRRSL